ncbi:hypothetical protein JCM10207_008781 [Rhodosporidiobolus poonsookiae]
MARWACCCSCKATSRTTQALTPLVSPVPPRRNFATFTSTTRPRPSLSIAGTGASAAGASAPGSTTQTASTRTAPPHASTPLAFPSPTSRPFSSSASAQARVADASTSIDLTFPSKPDPSPFEIFHFRRDAPLTRAEVKSRYLDLVKLYHPDRAIAAGKDEGKRGRKGKEPDYEFKLIVAAYELLADPKRRETYLRSGLGWGKTGGFGVSGGGGGPASPWSQSTAEYHFRRGRPMSNSARPGAYAYDWASGDSWTDPHNPHFRVHRDGAGMSASGAAAGWGGEGLLGRNGMIFLALASVTLLVTPMTAWYAVPTAPGEGPLGLGSTGPGGPGGAGEAWMPRSYDARHMSAAQNLQLARHEARTKGHEKREAIKRRVEQIRREQAYDRALEVQAVERREAGTGHLALPPPSAAV